jgi:hypothetical protein
MDTYQSRVHTVETEDGIEFHAYSRNQYGTGFDLVVSNPIAGHVDIVLYQIICNEVPDEPSISMCLPVPAVLGMLQAMQGGANVAIYHARLKKYH